MATVDALTIPLDLMEAGERGIVVDFDGRSDLVMRLQEMGLQSGARIRMIRPGAPCIIEIDHQRISFRLDESVTVLVDIHR